MNARRALTAGVLAVGLATGAALADSLPAQAATMGGSCSVRLTYGSAQVSYSTRYTLFGANTHVVFVATGDAYRFVWDHLYTGGGKPALRGIVGTVDGPRTWDAWSGFPPRVLSVGVVDVNNGAHGGCHT